MAYSTPATQSTGDVIGASQWNILVNNDKWFANERPFCRAARLTNQTIANATSTAVTFGSNDVDTASIHSTAVNPSRFTAPVNAWYRLTAQIYWGVDVDGVRMVSWEFNGTGVAVAQDSRISFGIFAVAQQVTALVALAPGQYVEVKVLHAAGSNLDVGAGSWASMEWVKT